VVALRTLGRGVDDGRDQLGPACRLCGRWTQMGHAGVGGLEGAEKGRVEGSKGREDRGLGGLIGVHWERQGGFRSS